jgi:hypothetical protein
MATKADRAENCEQRTKKNQQVAEKVDLRGIFAVIP